MIEQAEELYFGTVVKWEFDHGFIHEGAQPLKCQGKGCNGCIFVHYTGLNTRFVPRRAGKRFVDEQTSVTYKIMDGKKGTQAFDVRVVR